MSQLPRYESYKDSGVQWLGEIPSHWEVWKITHAMDLIGSGTTPKSDNLEYYDGDVLWVTTSELRESYIYDTKQKVTDSAIQDYSALKKYPINSIAIAMYGATIGRLGILAKEATFNQACCVFSGSKVLNHKFLYYWLWMRRPILISLSNGGGQPNLSQDDLKKLKLALPPMDEQKIITDFLDKRLAQVDALISKQETLLEKLAEQRVALISHAVTKGLNPDVELKDSGDVFFGKIPKHWKVIALHFIVRLISGDSITALDFVADGDYPVYGGNGFRGYIDRYTHQGNYVLIGRQGALCGNINFASGYFFATEHAVVVNPLIDLNYKWLGFLLMAMNLNQYSTTAAQPGISAEVIGRLKILLPEIEEQNQIADFIETELRDIEELENKAIVLKDKLKEYCSTLITQVVTGKIDVRNLKVN